MVPQRDVHTFRPPVTQLVMWMFLTPISAVPGIMYTYALATGTKTFISISFESTLLVTIVTVSSILMGVYFIAKDLRTRLTISSMAIRMDECFRSREMALSSITLAEWQYDDKGMHLTLHDDHQRVELQLSVFEGRVNRIRELIESLHEIIPEELQRNWDEFQKDFETKHQMRTGRLYAP